MRQVHLPEPREWITGHRCLCGAGPFARVEELLKHAEFERAERETRRRSQQGRRKAARRQTSLPQGWGERRDRR